MTRTAPHRIGWGAFLAAAPVVAVTAPAMQLAYTAGAILIYGTLHGASDLAVAPRASRAALIATYGVGVLATLAWWLVAPLGALCGFLMLSAVHFGLDDAPAERPMERWCRGILMVGAPALLHRSTLAGLFAALTGSVAGSALLATALAIGAAVALALLPLALAWRRADRGALGLLAMGIAALVLLPPLVGFAVAFTLLHARGQLAERMLALGCARLPTYLRRTAPVLAGAAAVLGGTALLFVDGRAPALSTVFAALAALATPHMLAPRRWRMGEAGMTSGSGTAIGVAARPRPVGDRWAGSRATAISPAA